MAMARSLLLAGLAVVAGAGCYGSTGWLDRGAPLPQDGEVRLSAGPAAAAFVPIHVTDIGEASEASEKIGVRGMFGVMVRARGAGLNDPVDDPLTAGSYESDADYPVIVMDINYTDELDENFTVEVSFGSIVIGDGFRVPYPGSGLPPSRYELKAKNSFFILGGTALFRLGSGRLGRFYGGVGVNLYINNLPGKEENFGPVGMVTWKMISGPTWSVSIDAKYWKIGLGNLQYVLIGGNLSRRF